MYKSSLWPGLVYCYSICCLAALSLEAWSAELTADNRATIQSTTQNSILDMISDQSTMDERQFSFVGTASQLSITTFAPSEGSHTIMTIAPDAMSNALILHPNGVGIGTNSPATKLHIRHPSAGGHIGFGSTLNNWRMGCQSVDFHIIDTTTGLFPFVIESGAPSNSLVVNSIGVGLGTVSPGTLLHARKKNGNLSPESIARFDIDDDNVGRLEVNNASATNATFIPRLQGRSTGPYAALIMEAIVAQDTGSNPAIVYNTVKGSGGGLAVRPMVAYRNNNVAKVTVFSDGKISATAFNTSSSRTVKNDIANLDSKVAADALRDLTPVEFVYKEDELAEKYVGFIAEDVPEVVANADRKSVPAMDVTALLTRVVKDQQQTIATQKATFHQREQAIAEQQQALDQRAALIKEISERVAKLESQMQNGK